MGMEIDIKSQIGAIHLLIENIGLQLVDINHNLHKQMKDIEILKKKIMRLEENAL
jgi:hypothetical protein